MYLKSIKVENVGPIPTLRVELPFRDGLPLPLVLVGPNGSGKSTLLSLIVNALVGFKQQAFEQAEIEHNRVYRVRSQMFIRGGTNWSHAKLEFEEGLSLEEWVLDRPRKTFEAEVNPLPADPGWRQIPEDGTSFFMLTPQPQNLLGRVPSKPIQKLFQENVVLFFPSDRFELPDWLNQGSLATELRFPEPVRIEGQTARRIFSRALLHPTLEWLKAVVLDARLSDLTLIQLPIGAGGTFLPVFIATEGQNSRIIGFVGKVLARILGADSDQMRFIFSHRNMGFVSAQFERSGRAETVPNLLGLSAGQASLFCLFSNIIRDFDLSGAQFNDISDIRGIVILDEADLHLHVDLQYRVLPNLVKLFPKVQFIVTAHSPLLVMGMEQAFGNEGFRVIEMPSGESIETEAFSEFDHALAAFTRTRAFDQRVLDHIRRATKPVVIVEGKSDVTHLKTAWEKLHPGRPLPWDIVSCGGVGTEENRGGAKMLKTLLEACCLHIERPALGLFDHDQEGVEQHRGLKASGFVEADDRTHWKHSTKSVQSLLLPVPPDREIFVGPKARSCYLAIEHYYSDSLLKRFGVADDPVAADSAVFRITSDSKRKARFADALSELDKAEFANFDILFDRLTQLLGVQTEPVLGAPPEDQPIMQSPGAGSTTLQMPIEPQVTPIMIGAEEPITSGLEPAEPIIGPEVVKPDSESGHNTTRGKPADNS
jgi:predicted ATPase